MKLSPEANALLADLWRCHEHNPINHFEYLHMENERWAIAHPASRRTVDTDRGALEEIVRLGLLRGRYSLSLTYMGIRYCEARRQWK